MLKIKLKSKRVFYLLLILPSIAFGQVPGIDSIQILPPSPSFTDVVSVHIYGTNAGTGERITNTTTWVINNYIEIKLFENACSGAAVLTPYDTIVVIGLLEPGNYSIECYAIYDTSIADTINCWVIDSVPIVYDSITSALIVTSIGILPSDHELNIYPNPAYSDVNIDLPSKGILRVEVLNSLGMHLKEFAIQSHISKSYRLDLNYYLPGLYLTKIYDGEHVYIGRFLKQ